MSLSRQGIIFTKFHFYGNVPWYIDISYITTFLSMISSLISLTYSYAPSYGHFYVIFDHSLRGNILRGGEICDYTSQARWTRKFWPIIQVTTQSGGTASDKKESNQRRQFS